MLTRMTRLWRSSSGLAAVELGLIAPLLGVMLVGTVSICNALACHRKIIDLASNVSGLIAMGTSVTSTDISNAYNAGNAIMYPYSPSNTTIVISSIVYSAATQTDKVAWSRSQNGIPLGVGSIVSAPPGVIATTDGASAILVSVTHQYSPPFGIFGTIPMSFQFYSRPRQSLSVSCNGC